MVDPVTPPPTEGRSGTPESQVVDLLGSGENGEVSGLASYLNEGEGIAEGAADPDIGSQSEPESESTNEQGDDATDADSADAEATGDEATKTMQPDEGGNDTSKQQLLATLHGRGTTNPEISTLENGTEGYGGETTSEFGLAQSLAAQRAQSDTATAAQVAAGAIRAEEAGFERLRQMMTAFTSVENLLGGGGFVDGIDQLRDEAAQEAAIRKMAVGSGIAVSGGLSVGYVISLARSGVLLSGVLSSMPAWRLIDPFPVLASGNGALAGRDEDESLESIASSSGDHSETDMNTETETDTDGGGRTGV